MNFKRQIRDKKEIKNGKSCKTEDVKIKNFNLFKDEKDDNYYVLNPTEKKMYKNKPIPRNRQKTTIDIECNMCEEVFTVNKIFLREDPDPRKKQQLIYTCDQCLASKK